jgi:FAD/FMN-containing dehydrogenase
MSRSNTEALDHLTTLVSAAEIISPTSDQYLSKTSTWAAQKNKHPSLVIQPTSTKSLSKIIAYLSTTDLDIGVRSSGYGSASARDVLISMSAFDEFEFDKDKEILTIGAGQLWRDYYEKMEKVAPGYQGTFSAPVLNLARITPTQFDVVITMFM